MGMVEPLDVEGEYKKKFELVRWIVGPLTFNWWVRNLQEMAPFLGIFFIIIALVPAINSALRTVFGPITGFVIIFGYLGLVGLSAISHKAAFPFLTYGRDVYLVTLRSGLTQYNAITMVAKRKPTRITVHEQQYQLHKVATEIEHILPKGTIFNPDVIKNLPEHVYRLWSTIKEEYVDNEFWVIPELTDTTTIEQIQEKVNSHAQKPTKKTTKQNETENSDKSISTSGLAIQRITLDPAPGSVKDYLKSGPSVTEKNNNGEKKKDDEKPDEEDENGEENGSTNSRLGKLTSFMKKIKVGFPVLPKAVYQFRLTDVTDLEVNFIKKVKKGTRSMEKVWELIVRPDYNLWHFQFEPYRKSNGFWIEEIYFKTGSDINSVEDLLLPRDDSVIVVRGVHGKVKNLLWGIAEVQRVNKGIPFVVSAYTKETIANRPLQVITTEDVETAELHTGVYWRNEYFDLLAKYKADLQHWYQSQKRGFSHIRRQRRRREIFKLDFTETRWKTNILIILAFCFLTMVLTKYGALNFIPFGPAVKH